MKYEVTVSANIRTTWEAEDKDEAVRMAEQWTADEYGGLVHKADFIVREIN